MYILYFMDINLLVKIASRAWAMDILKLMNAGVPGRQAALLSASGAGRTAFAQSLKHLIDLKLVERTKGHGHPLRPEYQLTELGHTIAGRSEKMFDVAQADPDAAMVRRAWTLPILAVSSRPVYFSEIKSSLPNITDRALSKSLKTLTERKWMQRDVRIELHPPRPIYQSVSTGAEISRIFT